MRRKLLLVTGFLIAVTVIVFASLWLYIFGLPFSGPASDVTRETLAKGKDDLRGKSQQNTEPTIEGVSTTKRSALGHKTSVSSQPVQSIISTLPPEGALLRDSIGDLRLAAESGNRTAYCRLSKELYTCFNKHPETRHVRHRYNPSGNQRVAINPSQMSQKDREHYERVRAASAFCNGLSKDVFEGAWLFMYRDALSGHKVAMREFALMGPYPVDMLSGEGVNAMRTYREYASVFLHTAADRGDMLAIYELAQAYAGSDERPPHLRPVSLVRDDKQQALSYAYLYKILDGIMEYWNDKNTELINNLERELTAAELAQAKKWAGDQSVNIGALLAQRGNSLKQKAKDLRIYFGGGCEV